MNIEAFCEIVHGINLLSWGPGPPSFWALLPNLQGLPLTSEPELLLFRENNSFCQFALFTEMALSIHGFQSYMTNILAPNVLVCPEQTFSWGKLQRTTNPNYSALL